MDNLIKFITDFKNRNSHYSLSLGVCTTSINSNKPTKPYISFPREYKKNNFYFHCVLFKSKDANFLIQSVKNKITNFFIDIENKNSDFNWKEIVTKNKIKNFFPIQPNKITVDGIILNFLSLKVNKKILVLGSGNLAFSLCSELSFIEQDFKWLVAPNRNSKSINKMKSYFADFKILKGFEKFDIIINTIPSDLKIKYNELIKYDTLFIEVSGASLNFLSSLKCKKIRFDVSIFLSEAVLSLENIFSKVNNTGRSKYLNNKYICSGGYLGSKGDLIVDNFRNPKYLIGISDGKGGYIKRYNLPFDEYLTQK